MYLVIKSLHNIIRWLVVLGGIYAIVTALRGLITQATWTAQDKRAGIIFTGALGLQFVVGFLLYFISPLVKGALQNMTEAMQVTELRFFAVEHMTYMILAVVAAQLGYSLGSRARTDKAKFLRTSIGYVLAGILLVVGIPWWRPLFPGL